MRINYLLLLIFINTKLLAQEYPLSDSLKKYSYFINGANYEDTTGHDCFGQGTGFFIKKKKEKRYFSAKHVLLNCNYYGDKVGCRPDKMMVYYNDNDKVRIG